MAQEDNSGRYAYPDFIRQFRRGEHVRFSTGVRTDALFIAKAIVIVGSSGVRIKLSDSHADQIVRYLIDRLGGSTS